MRFSLSAGDITSTASDCLVTLINSERLWWGGVDNAIRRVAGNYFHDQAASARLEDGVTILAKGKEASLSFRNVLFVVDDLRQPLRNLTLKALEAANEHGFRKITFPAMRTGVMAGVVEKNASEVAEEMKTAFLTFLAKYPEPKIEHVEIVIFRDPQFERLLQKSLGASLN